jgi:hypothetical protein
VSVFAYAEDGGRIPFDPLTTGAHLAGCILCGRRRIATVGIFVPATDAMRAVVLCLRRHAVPERSTGCIAYGLCRRCMKHVGATDHVEAALVAAAGKVTVQ